MDTQVIADISPDGLNFLFEFAKAPARVFAVKHANSPERYEVGVEITDSSMPVGQQGHLLMQIERELSDKFGMRFEIYSRERKDENKLRLQTLEKIADWKKRRRELKE